jgi:hypothetical protein
MLAAEQGLNQVLSDGLRWVVENTITSVAPSGTLYLVDDTRNRVAAQFEKPYATLVNAIVIRYQ